MYTMSVSIDIEPKKLVDAKSCNNMAIDTLDQTYRSS